MKQMMVLLMILLPLYAAVAAGVEQLFSVRTVKVTQINAATAQTSYGYVRAQDSRMVDVAPRFGGYVETLIADTRYDKIKKGAPLARVYSPEVLQAKEDYLTALRFNATNPSPAMLRSVRTKLTLLGVSNAEIEQVRTQMRAEPLTTLYAPASGWLFEKNILAGAAFTSGTTLFRIVNLDKVWIEAAIYQDDLPGVNALKTFTVRATGVSTGITAKKLLVYPQLASGTATATLRLEADNADEMLLPGMYVSVAAQGSQRAVLTLPRSAVIRRDGAWYVFNAGDFKGIYDPQKVQVRPLDNQRFEILSGLSAGDEVANHAMFLLDADAQISGLE